MHTQTVLPTQTIPPVDHKAPLWRAALLELSVFLGRLSLGVILAHILFETPCTLVARELVPTDSASEDVEEVRKESRNGGADAREKHDESGDGNSNECGRVIELDERFHIEKGSV